MEYNVTRYICIITFCFTWRTRTIYDEDVYRALFTSIRSAKTYLRLSRRNFTSTLIRIFIRVVAVFYFIFTIVSNPLYICCMFIEHHEITPKFSHRLVWSHFFLVKMGRIGMPRHVLMANVLLNMLRKFGSSTPRIWKISLAKSVILFI